MPFNKLGFINLVLFSLVLSFSSLVQSQNIQQYACSGQIWMTSIPYPAPFFQVVNARSLEEAQLLATKIFNQQYNPDGITYNMLINLTCQAA